MTWYAFALCSVTALAAAELTQQRILTHSAALTPRISAILTFLFQALFALPILFSLDLHKDLFSIFSRATGLWFLAVALVGSFAMIFYLQSLKAQTISFSCLFLSWSAIVAAILGVVFFDEGMGLQKSAGILLVLSAIAVVHLRNAGLEKNHLYGLIAGLLFGICFTLDKKILLLGIHPLLYMFWVFLAVAVFGSLRDLNATFRAVTNISKLQLRAVVISAIGYFTYNFCTFSAYTRGGEVGRVDAINNSQVCLIILVEYLVYGQRQGTIRKLGAFALVASGVLLLRT